MLQRLPRCAKSLHKRISANLTTGDNGCEKGGGLPKVIVQVGATAEAAVAADAALGVEGSAAADVARGPRAVLQRSFFGHQLNQLHSRHGPTQRHPSTLQAAGGAAAGEAATAAEAAATAEAVVAADAVVAAEGAWHARM